MILGLMILGLSYPLPTGIDYRAQTSVLNSQYPSTGSTVGMNQTRSSSIEILPRL